MYTCHTGWFPRYRGKAEWGKEKCGARGDLGGKPDETRNVTAFLRQDTHYSHAVTLQVALEKKSHIIFFFLQNCHGKMKPSFPSSQNVFARGGMVKAFIDKEWVYEESII